MNDETLVQRALRLLSQPPERVKPKEALRPQKALDPIPTILVGDRIEWHRAGSVQHGTVDFVHVDDAGTRWAFVTLVGGWAAVNLKFATAVTA